MHSVPTATLTVPIPVSALAFLPDGDLCVGSDDGSLRRYKPPFTRVAQAVKPMGDEISSIAMAQPKKNQAGTIWVAVGRQALAFPLGSTKMILTKEDVTSSLDIGEDDEDVLNELSISDTGKHLAFSSDSGAVGIVDLASNSITRMKNSHNTVCGSVKFIPDRPCEIISGGYDFAVLHFDSTQGNILSRLDITAPPPSGGVSLSPPFVLSLSVNSAGLVAVGTADGRVWLGGGGEKRQNNKKKRSRKWEGLKEDEGIWLQVADGPVVSTAFASNDRLVTCSLLGVVAEYVLSRDAEDALQATRRWETSTKTLEKVNAMAARETCVAVGGFGKDGKGLVEVWDIVQDTT